MERESIHYLLLEATGESAIVSGSGEPRRSNSDIHYMYAVYLYTIHISCIYTVMVFLAKETNQKQDKKVVFKYQGVW